MLKDRCRLAGASMQAEGSARFRRRFRAGLARYLLSVQRDEIDRVVWSYVPGAHEIRRCVQCLERGVQPLERGVENVTPGVEITRRMCGYCGHHTYGEHQLAEAGGEVPRCEVCDLEEIDVSKDTIRTACSVCGRTETLTLS
jgi:hypothetical protein